MLYVGVLGDKTEQSVRNFIQGHKLMNNNEVRQIVIQKQHTQDFDTFE